MRKIYLFICICRKAHHKVTACITYGDFSQRLYSTFPLVLNFPYRDSVHMLTPQRKKTHFISLDWVLAFKEQYIKNYALWLIVHKTTKGAKIAQLKKKETRWSLFQPINPSVFKQTAAILPFVTYWNVRNLFSSGYTYTSVETFILAYLIVFEIK